MVTLITDLRRWSRQSFVEVIYSYCVQQDLISPEFGISQIMVNRNRVPIGDQWVGVHVDSLFLPPTILKGPTCIILENDLCCGKRHLEEDIVSCVE